MGQNVLTWKVLTFLMNFWLATVVLKISGQPSIELSLSTKDLEMALWRKIFIQKLMAQPQISH